PLPVPYNRYPDPLQTKLKQKISAIKGAPVQHIFVGNACIEGIDILYRAFWQPATDNSVLVTPTFGMYAVTAHINDVSVKRVPLTPDFQLDLEGIAEAIDSHTRLIFICSPNTPTGNSVNRADVETLLANFDGLVVVDEAYINFSRQKSFIQELPEY